MQVEEKVKLLSGLRFFETETTSEFTESLLLSDGPHGVRTLPMGGQQNLLPFLG
jgi:hypothetical protein